MKKVLLFIAVLFLTFSCKEEDPVYIYGNIAGKVTEEGTNLEIEGVTVELSGIEQSKKTGSNGAYIFEKIPADNYTIYVSKNGYISDSKTITVVAEQTMQGDFSLTKDLPTVSPNFITLTNEKPSVSVELENTRSREMDFTTQISKGWLTANPASGTIADHNKRIITITADFSKVDFGEYDEKMVINVGEASLSIPIAVSYVRPSYIAITKPIKDEQYKMGETMSIIWNSNLSGSVKIELLRFSSVTQTISTSTENNNGGNYSWLIPVTDAANYQITVSSIEHPKVTNTTDAFSILEGPTPPMVSTGNIVELNSASFKIEGTITNLGLTMEKVSQYGHVYSDVNPLPTISDNKTTLGEIKELITYLSTISSVESGKTYYVRAYATNEKGTSYGEILTVNIPADIPIVSTASVVSITETTAVSGGNIISDGGNSITERGVCWGKTSPVTTSSNILKDSEAKAGTFSSNISGLDYGTVYYIRAYANNSAGTGYGNELSFNTLAGLAYVSTVSITNVTSSSATVNCSISENGGGNITSFGVCYSENSAPTIGDSFYEAGKDTIGNYSFTISSLKYETLYYVRSYATNSAGTAYGEEKTFKTGGLANVKTVSATALSAKSAKLIGYVTDNGGEDITLYGFCYSKSTSQTIDNDKKEFSGNHIGEFTSEISNLNAKTKYYVRAFATNAAGTNYGEEINFTTNEGKYLSIITPNENESISVDSSYLITWSTNYGSQRMYIELWRNGSQLSILSDNCLASALSFSWSVPGTLQVANDYTIKFIDYSTFELLAESPKFTIAGKLEYISPIEYARIDSVYIAWSINYETTLKIELFKYSQLSKEIASNISSTKEHLLWNGEEEGIKAGEGYRIRITDKSDESITATSEAITIYNEDEIFTDPRDGNVYKVVTIGNQQWFASNLRFEYTGSEKGVEGRLYHLGQISCPTGWHLPSDGEWATLEKYLGMPSEITYTIGNRESGNVGSLLCSSNIGFNAITNAGHWWSSTFCTYNERYYYREIKNSGVYRYYGYGPHYVRCIKTK